VALSVCLLLDARADAAVRGLWRRLEAAGVPTLLSHTHGRHVPHLTLASLRGGRLDSVTGALANRPTGAPLEVTFEGLGSFRRSRCWLAPAVTHELVSSQHRVAASLEAAGAELHQHYRPSRWVPHLTLAPRLHLRDLTTVAAHVYDVLPLPAVLERGVVIDTSTGEHHALPNAS
jgi:2'-5' RNA ligase